VWSPDGHGIAFLDAASYGSDEPSPLTIKVLLLPSEVRTVGQFEGETDLFWLPGSHHVVYGDGGRLLAVDIRSKSVRKVGRFTGKGAALSPDGKWVATVRPHPSGVPVGNVWISTVEGTKNTCLTDFRALGPRVDRHARLSWSRDGQWIAFAVAPVGLRTFGVSKGRADSEAYYAQERLLRHRGIWVVGARTKRAMRLTEGYDYWPSWSPSGSEIAFLREGGDEMWVVDVASRSAKRLPGAWFDSVNWSPSGDRLAYSSVEDSCIHVLTLPPTFLRFLRESGTGSDLRP